VVAIDVNFRGVKLGFISITKAKHFELIAVKVNVYKDSHITVVGCYRPPSASGEALNSF
jgi:hypothetical protein